MEENEVENAQAIIINRVPTVSQQQISIFPYRVLAIFYCLSKKKCVHVVIIEAEQ